MVVMPREIDPTTEYAEFKRVVASLIPLRLDLYKQQQMERRIRDMARKHQAPTLIAFGQMLRTDAGLCKAFEQHLTINVSEFYRNPEAFDYLATRLLPQQLPTTRGLHVWSAGCSYGAEAYTIAMLLRERAPQAAHTLYASDIDSTILAQAKSGRGYTADDIAHLPAPLRQKYISAQGPPFAVAPELVRMVRFGRHDLLSDRMTQTFDLIACRNVVIYFTDEAKLELYKTFVSALQPGGYLFIGATEVISGAAQIGLRYVAPCFYLKTA